MESRLGLDVPLHDTYFVVCHFHFGTLLALAGCACLACLAWRRWRVRTPED